MFVMSLINDNIAFGVSRSFSYILLAICYLLLAISTPDTAALQYLWIVHHPAALVLVVNSFTLCSLYPARAGLLINIAAGLLSVSSMIPQAWLTAVNNGFLTRSQILYIWLGLTMVTFCITTFIYPWHSVTDPDYYPNVFTVIKSPLMSVFRPPNRKSLIDNARQCTSMMESPIFWTQVLTKVACHYVMTLSVMVANDMMKRSRNALEVGYNNLQTQYELTRGITR